MKSNCLFTIFQIHRFLYINNFSRQFTELTFLEALCFTYVPDEYKREMQHDIIEKMISKCGQVQVQQFSIKSQDIPINQIADKTV